MEPLAAAAPPALLHAPPSAVARRVPEAAADQPPTLLSTLAPWLLVALVVGWAVLFGQLALLRHASGGSHAEDLGFTDQVLWNLSHGRWFEMTIYQGAFWNTELDAARLLQPSSLMAFHVEPLLLAFAPLYMLGGTLHLLLVLQAAALALGAIPTYRLGERAVGSPLAGLVVALVYLLSPLGQWAALDDFHTTAFATPLLLLAVERLTAGRDTAAVLAASVAVLAREDAALTVAALGLAALLAGRSRGGVALLSLGAFFAFVDLLVIRSYSGAASPLAGRYGPILAGGLPALFDALSRSSVLGYVATLLLTGAWLGLFAPLAFLPALPAFALNVLSSSLWMASGKAHYSALVLPFVVASAAAGLAVARRRRPAGVPFVYAALLVGSLAAYLNAGAGPFGGAYAPAAVTDHARLAQALADSIPPDAAVAASSPLVPHLSSRARVYVFPAVEDASYIALDVTASAAPTSPGDVYLRVRNLLAAGGWRVARAEDGLLLLAHDAAAPPTSPDDFPAAFYTFTRAESVAPSTPGIGSFLEGRLTLLSADLQPSTTGALEPDGPRGTLRTVWVANGPLPAGSTPRLTLSLTSGETLPPVEVAGAWWRPLQRWPPGVPIRLDIPNVPLHDLGRWQLEVASLPHP